MPTKLEVTVSPIARWQRRTLLTVLGTAPVGFAACCIAAGLIRQARVHARAAAESANDVYEMARAGYLNNELYAHLQQAQYAFLLLTLLMFVLACVMHRGRTRAWIKADRSGIRRGTSVLVRRRDLSYAHRRGTSEVVLGYFFGETVVRTRSADDADALLAAMGYGSDAPVILGNGRTRMVVVLGIISSSILLFTLGDDAVIDVLSHAPRLSRVDHVPAFVAVPLLVTMFFQLVGLRWPLFVGVDGLRVGGALGSRFVPYADIVAAQKKEDQGDRAHTLVLHLASRPKPLRVSFGVRDDLTSFHALIERRRAAARERAQSAAIADATVVAGPEARASYRVADVPSEQWLAVVADGTRSVGARMRVADALVHESRESVRQRVVAITEASACLELRRYGRRALR